jgi:hypothetical protein
MGPQPEARRVPSCLEIFREKYLTAGLLGSANDERVREREVVQSLKIDGGQDVTKVGTEDVELGQEFELPPSNPNIKVQFTSNRHKVLLQNLHQDNTSTTTSVFCYESQGTAPLGRAGFTIGTDEYVGVKKKYERSWVSSLDFQLREWPPPESFSNSLMLRSGSSAPASFSR